MIKPTGKLAFAYQSITNLEAKIEAQQAEIAELKEWVAQLETGISAFFSNEIPEGDALAQEMCMRGKQYRNAIAQQAEAIRMKDEALELACDGLAWYVDQYPDSVVETQYGACRQALTLQPSPDILKERDENVAEALIRYFDNTSKSADMSSRENTTNIYVAVAEAIRSGEWRKYL